MRSLLKEAKRRGICGYCGKEVDQSIMDESDLKENAISGMCKLCLDRVFKKKRKINDYKNLYKNKTLQN